MSSLRRWPDRLSEIIVSLQKQLSASGPDRTRNRKSTDFYTVRKHILGYATELITALGGDPEGHEKISNQTARDIERGAASHAQSGDHEPWPDTKESTASYFGQAIFKYHRCIEILEALVWLGHPDSLSVVIHDSCDCCGEPVSLYEAFEEKKYELVRAGPYIGIDADDLDSFLSYHESVLRYANGDRSPDLLLKLGLLKRKVYVTGRYWFNYCTATFCPLCRAEYELRRSWIRAITPQELAGPSRDDLGTHAELPDRATLDQAAAMLVVEATAPAPPIVLGGPDDEVIVWGKRKPPLPPAQYRAVKALVEAHAEGERLSKDILCHRTTDAQGNMVEDRVKALKRLFKRDRDYEEVIDMAKIPGRGYGLKHRPPTSTHKNRENHPRPPRGG